MIAPIDHRGWLLALMLSAGFPAHAGNDLASHVSPYVAMHSDDPVNWRVWSAAVMDEARSSGKLVFVTSGYFSCYWCHVMQEQSFRDAEVAALAGNARVLASTDPVTAMLLAVQSSARGSGDEPAVASALRQ